MKTPSIFLVIFTVTSFAAMPAYAGEPHVIENFDIAGVKLGMNHSDAGKALEDQGYSLSQNITYGRSFNDQVNSRIARAGRGEDLDNQDVYIYAKSKPPQNSASFEEIPHPLEGT